MLRDLSTITVRHENNKIETIIFPEDIGSELFQAGAFPVFGMRMKAASVAGVRSGSGAEKAGVKPEDILISVNNKEVTYFDEIQKSLYDNKGKKVEVGVLRKNSSGSLDTLSLNAKVDKEGKIGFEVAMGSVEDSVAIETKSYSFFEKVVSELKIMYNQANLEMKIFNIGADEVPYGVWQNSPICNEFLSKVSKSLG